MATVAAPATAQSGGSGFLFSAPKGALTLSVGVASPRGESALFDDIQSLLTLSTGDFRSAALAVEYAHEIRAGLDITASIGYAGRTAQSEFRDWVDSDELPITQQTSFARIPLVAGVRFYPWSRGESFGNLAWAPAPVAPYLAAGTGAMWYSFRQNGDFVDFQDLEIISDNLSSSGWAPLVQFGGGADVTVSPQLALGFDLRYTLADAKLKGDYQGFDRIDLSGFAATAGLRIRY